MEEISFQVNPSELKPLGEVAYNVIRTAIIQGRLRPGQRLAETELAEKMGLSRTPIREALHKLELEGLVTTRPRRGTIVRELPLGEIEEIYVIRALLEGFAARLAARTIQSRDVKALERLLERMSRATGKGDVVEICTVNTRFHRALSAASKSARICNLIDTMRDQMWRFRLITMSVPGRPQAVLEEHRKMVDAVRDRDGELAERLLYQHALSALASIKLTLGVVEGRPPGDDEDKVPATLAEKTRPLTARG